MKSIESRHSVKCSTSDDNVLTIKGSKEGVCAALAEVKEIVDTVQVTLDIGKDLARCWLTKLATVVDPIKETGVKISNVKGGQAQVEGTPSVLSAFNGLTLELDIVRETVNCELRDLGVVIGQRGTRVKELEAMGTKIEVVKGDEPRVEILGRRQDAERVRSEVELVISQNEVVEDRVDVSGILRANLLKVRVCRVLGTQDG